LPIGGPCWGSRTLKASAFWQLRLLTLAELIVRLLVLMYFGVTFFVGFNEGSKYFKREIDIQFAGCEKLLQFLKIIKIPEI
jgi:hypothetical protein